MSDHDISVVLFNRPCPVCDGVMELSSIDSSPRRCGPWVSALRFCCRSCGRTRSEWSAIAVEAPSIAPD